MSVINKMLRDLDERRATGLETGLRTGTRVVQAQPEAPQFPVKRVALALVAAGLVAGAAAWWYVHTPSPAAQTQIVAAPAVAAPTAQAVSALPAAGTSAAVAMPSAAAASAALAATAPATGPSTPVVLPAAAPAPVAQAPVVAPEPRPVSAATPATPRAPEAKTSPEHAGLQLTPSTWGTTPPAAPKASTAAPAAPAAPEPAVQAQRQQNAARDALAQAQALYSAGSADAAITLLQDALSLAERANPAAPAAVQLSLVRELARMELAQGRAAAVLELLARVEPLLAGQADLWAVRANAAQRQGRHQEAVLFYATALQTRPAEQRWLLGSAVSLAAIGQLASAAELAEKARAIGPVSKDVLAYLRQQGVTLPDK